MIQPDLDEFKAQCLKGNLIPVFREILADMDTPVSAFLKLGGAPSFLLESVVGGEKWARYSFIGSRPSKIIRGSIVGSSVRIQIEENGKEPAILETTEPLKVLKDILSVYKPVENRDNPVFFGGMVGYLGYDMVRFFERVPDSLQQGIELPDMFFMVTDTLLIFDNLKKKIKVFSNAHTDGKGPEEAYREAVEKIERIIEKLRKPLPQAEENQESDKSTVKDIGKSKIDDNPALHIPHSAIEGFASSFGSKDAFEAAVLKAKEYVRAGDVIQVVLSQRFETESEARPFDIYRALRVINPSPYMYYLDTGSVKLVGSSPEILVRLEDEKVVLKPIAGTRKRGRTEAEDTALEEELKKDPKEMAEHIMLVDLGRNDVGRIAKTGSVKATEVMTVERYSHVMHLVSNVEGDLRSGLNAFDVLEACFPAGTVTGAPKVRAMEIIGELEPVKRGPYAGAVGYFSYSGNMDTCITIRTLVIKDNKVYVQAGAGIVADSDPESEYMETVNKAMAAMKAVDMAERGLE